MKFVVAGLAGALFAVALPADAAPSPPGSTTFFEEKIRPVLADQCFKCHSARSTKLKGGLRLDHREGLLKGGENGPAISSAKPEDSLLLKSLRHPDKDLRMPPDAQLSDEVIANFEKWVKAGAAFPETTASTAPAKDAKPWWDTLADKDLLPADRPMAQVVDHYIAAKLTQAKAKSAPAASEANFIRRLTLDLVGRIPTTAEVRAYVAATEPDKAARLADRLMSSPGFVRHQVTEFEWLLNEGQGTGFREYLTRAIGEGRRWDRVFKEVITGDTAAPDTQGADAFLRARAKDLDKLVTDVSVRFFGVNISCAQCHDHPLVPAWKQDHYYGMKSFFSRTFEHGDFVAERDYGTISFKTTAGETKEARLMFLSGEAVAEPPAPELTEAQKKEEKKLLEETKKNKQPAPAPKFSRRALLPEASLKPGHEGFFARAVVNQVWLRFFGHGLVMPVDQMHGQNLPNHPELLQWLARDLVQHDYDVRRLIRGLVLSAAYARSSQWSDGARPDPGLFAVAQPRALTPQQVGASLQFAVTGPDAFKSTAKPEEQAKFIEQVERTGQGWASSLERPGDDFQVGVDEALLFSNNDRIQRELLSLSGDRLLKVLLDLKDNRELATAAVWNVLSRAPEPRELQAITSYLDQRSDRPTEAARQVVWSLLTSTEFRFNH
jgi:hypothetical protein